MRPKELTHKIDGELYFTVKHFAYVTKHSEVRIRVLMKYGNRLRRLRVVRFGGKPFIPYEELTQFPFTMPGNARGTYFYSEEGFPIPSV